MATKTIGNCASCDYPIATERIGEKVTCPMCQTVNETIAQNVTIPGVLFWSVLAFGLGMLLGPTVIASTSEGRKWLEEQARAGIRK